MSLLAAAKANGIEPHAWLTDVLTRLSATKDRDIDSLLPTSGYRHLPSAAIACNTRWADACACRNSGVRRRGRAPR